MFQNPVPKCGRKHPGHVTTTNSGVVVCFTPVSTGGVLAASSQREAPGYESVMFLTLKLLFFGVCKNKKCI